MISKIRIKNFKSIIDLELEIDCLKTILVGQNEAGKSSILEALDAFELAEFDSDNINYECENNENFKQEISIQYHNSEIEIVDFNNDIKEDILHIIKNSTPESQLSKMEFSPEKLSKIEKFELTRVFEYQNSELNEYMQLDLITLRKIIGATKSNINESTDGNKINDVDVEETFMSRDVNKKFAELFHAYCPQIVLFNDFSDILPDKIEVQKINETSNIEGKTAVKNIEKILGCSFSDWSNQNVRRKRTNTEKASNQISVEFLSDWNQKIDDNNRLKIEFDIEKNGDGVDEVHFFIETKEGVKLEPRKRSQGLRWFLSLWLEIKAESKNSPMILLFDEPGAHLHINAMKDMMSLFDKLSSKGNQIIYSTHLPSMIDLKKIENLRLVIHDKIKGTIIESVTSNKFHTQNRRDALQPIAQAMGMHPLTEFSVMRQKNVIVEGISDMLYFQAMRLILSKNDDYAIIPGIGVKNEKLNSLISFCIGYGLEWLVVIDKGYNPDSFIEQLKKSFYDDESEVENFKSIYTTTDKEIEDLFTLDDMKQLGLHLTGNIDKSVSELIGVKRKLLFATQFKILVESKTITKKTLNASTIKNFESIFNWIDQSFSETNIK